MTTTARQIELLAEHLDAAGKPDAPITVVGTRANLRAKFKAGRGKPLKCGGHELRLVSRPPKDAAAENLDWVDAREPEAAVRTLATLTQKLGVPA